MDSSFSPPVPSWPLLAIVGQTASGKTAFSLQLCHYLQQCYPDFIPEVVCADAFQLYKGMDIGTAKVSAAEQGQIPHHQIDVLSISQPASVAAYQRAARSDIERIYQRGHVPIIVGGSGLYVRALLDKISFPGTDLQLRQRLRNQAEQEGIVGLFEQLKALDPLSAQRLRPSDTRRVVRALEVCLLTGRPFSATLPEYRYFYPRVFQIGLAWENEQLDLRIAKRSAQMIRNGFLEEVRYLLTWGLAQSPTALRATGYQAALDCLAGRITLSQLEEQLITQTRQLARKQRKWFRRDPRICWLTMGQTRCEVLPRKTGEKDSVQGENVAPGDVVEETSGNGLVRPESSLTGEKNRQVLGNLGTGAAQASKSLEKPPGPVRALKDGEDRFLSGENSLPDWLIRQAAHSYVHFAKG